MKKLKERGHKPIMTDRIQFQKHDSKKKKLLNDYILK